MATLELDKTEIENLSNKNYIKILDFISQVSSDLYDNIDLLLNTMEDDLRITLKKCAIPYEFDLNILDVILSKSKRDINDLYDRLLKLSIISPVNNKLYIRDKVRKYLFNQWLKNLDTHFLNTNEKLASYYKKLIKNFNSKSKESFIYLENNYLFHQCAVVEQKGRSNNKEELLKAQVLFYKDLNKTFDLRNRENNFNSSYTLINLINVYASIMSEELQLILLKAEGKTTVKSVLYNYGSISSSEAKEGFIAINYLLDKLNSSSDIIYAKTYLVNILFYCGNHKFARKYFKDVLEYIRWSNPKLDIYSDSSMNIIIHYYIENFDINEICELFSIDEIELLKLHNELIETTIFQLKSI